MELLVLDHDVVLPRRVALRDRVVATLRSSRLDADLARGASPETSVLHGLRARYLLSDPSLTGLSTSLRQLVWMARPRPPGMLHPTAGGPCRLGCVYAQRGDLLDIARRLIGADPVGVAGVAAIRVLLSDGGGPLYRAGRCGELPERLSTVAADLDPMAHLW